MSRTSAGNSGASSLRSFPFVYYSPPVEVWYTLLHRHPACESDGGKSIGFVARGSSQAMPVYRHVMVLCLLTFHSVTIQTLSAWRRSSSRPICACLARVSIVT